MKKRLLSIILILCMVMNMLPINALAATIDEAKATGAIKASENLVNPFTDVSKSDWFYNSVMYAIEHDLFKGTGDTSFSPNGSLTRGMYVTVMGHIAGVNPSDYKKSSLFSDVKADAYYAPYVIWAAEMGITTGVGNNKFDANGLVSREQMAVFTVKYFEAKQIKYGSAAVAATSQPKDLSGVSSWAQDAVLKLWAAGMIKGDANGNFNPKVNATRAEAATFTAQTNQVVEVWKTETAQLNPPTNPTTNPTTNPNVPPSLVTSADGGNDRYNDYTITFVSNGGTAVSAMSIDKGSVISDLPSPKKNNAVFLGWFTDPSFQGTKFTSENKVTSNLTLYAKYMTIEEISETEVDSTFSLAEQESTLVFHLTASNAGMTGDQVKTALGLENIDGSQPVALTVSGSNGVYSVSAVGGFTEGASYKLNLNDDALKFAGKEQAVRTCDFTIKKNEVFDIALNESMIYIPSSELSNIKKNDTSVNSLSVPVVVMGDTAGKTASTGSFTYSGSKVLKNGDVLCVYSGAKPVPGDDAAFLNNDIAYIKVTAVSGTKISYEDAASDEVVFLPDVLPVKVGTGHTVNDYVVGATTGTFTVPAGGIDFSAYAEMGLSAKTTIDVGDFLALYTSSDLSTAGENDVIYGEVTQATPNGGALNVTFTKTTVSAMQQSLDYYSKNDVQGDDLLEDVDTIGIQKDIEKQVVDSGFANRAAAYMTSLAMSTDGFKQMADSNGYQEYSGASIRGGLGLALNDLNMMALGSGSGIEDLKVKAIINTNTKQLSNGVRCAVEISFKVPIDIGDNNAIVIQLTSTFVEELKMSVKTSGDTIWKKKWIFPYISDYKMAANLDVYDFTGISFKSTITSKADTNTIDISEEIEKILASTETEEITAGVQELFELYGDMMDNDTDWVTLVSQNIAENNMSLLLGIIQIKISADFVVSADINVALGCNFEYRSGTRYSFWAKLKAKDAGSSTVDLMDETYTFQFYALGSLGLRAGIKLELAVGLFSVDLNSVGLTAEAGVYTRAFGYFFYELESINGVKTSNKSGALYIELGIYLETAFKAQVLNGLFQYNPTLYENEWPLLTAGDRYNVYDFAYKDGANINMKDKVRSYALPSNTYNMTYLDLREGDVSTKTYAPEDYVITLSDKHFTLSGNNILVNVPSGTHVLSSDLTVTWKSDSLAFSSVPISRTYHLVWDDLSVNGYTLSYVSNGGSAVASTVKKYGETVTAPANPTKTGYTFAGWYSDAQLTKPYVFSKMGWESVTLYAKWTPNANTAYKVNHYLQDLTNSNSYVIYQTEAKTGTTGAGVTAGVKTYSGFTAPATQIVTIAADGSTVVNYNYARNSYTLTFKPENGTENTVKTLKYGASITAPAVTKAGYTFDSWTALATVMPAANTTYTALWKANTAAAYTVKHYQQNIGSGDTLFETENLTGIFGTAVTPAPKAYDGFTAPIAQTAVILADGSMSISYFYTRNSYAVSFDSNGGTAQSSINGLYGSTYGTLPTPTKTGYDFNGWYDSETANNGSGTQVTAASAVSITAAQTLYAKWTAISNVAYTVKHYQQNIGSGNTLFETENLTGTWGASVTPAVKNYPGFNAPATQTATILLDGSMSISYYYTRNSYAVSFDSNGGTAQSSINVIYGSTYGTLPTPTRSGYDFNGWFDSETANNGSGTEVTAASAVSITAAQTLYAKWTAASIGYTVKHYQQNIGSGDTLFETENLTGTLGASITPAVKNYPGFTAPATQTATILLDGSMSISYYYTRNSYAVSFDSNGGSAQSSINALYGSTYGTLPTPTKTDYNFSGWYDSETADNGSGTEVTAASTVTITSAQTLYAKWTAISVPGPVTVNNLSELTAALADSGVTEVIVSTAISLPSGTNLNGNGKIVRAAIIGTDEAGVAQSGSSYNIFTINSGSTVTIQNLIVKGGSNTAIMNSGNLTMNSVTITQSGSSSVGGGGLNNSGKAFLTDCSIYKNIASNGGGFYNSSTGLMILNNSSVSENRSLFNGGGGTENGGTLYLNNSTFANNVSAEIGGAINNYMGTLYVLNSTITGNLVDTSTPYPCGGGIGNNGGNVKVINSLITNNYEKHSTAEAKPSDISEVFSSSNIYLYNSFCGAYITSVSANLAVIGTPSHNTDSVCNPVGNGLTDMFSAYSTVNGLNVAALVKLANGTYAAPLASASAAKTGGTDVYFDYDATGVTIVAYGSTPVYLIGTAGGTKMTAYQNGVVRNAGVIGAIEN